MLGLGRSEQGADRVDGDVGGEREERAGDTRSAVRSRVSGSGAENCQATIAAELTSTTESRPNPISAVEEAIVPAVMATIASITL